MPENGNEKLAWDRSYYEVAIEVRHVASLTNSKSKRFCKTKRNKDGTETTLDIGNSEDSIYAGQIFAEMLGAACHPEFFDHTDVEVFILTS